MTQNIKWGKFSSFGDMPPPGGPGAEIALMSALADYDWDWKGAEREFNATIAIDPNCAVAYQYYGYALFAINRGEEALAAMNKLRRSIPSRPASRPLWPGAIIFSVNITRLSISASGFLNSVPNSSPPTNYSGSFAVI